MKKNLIKLTFCLMACLSLLIVTGCEKDTNNDNVNENDQNNVTEATKGNCSAFECIKMIEPENTVEEINDIIGFEGELTDAEYNKYYWELSSNSGIEVTYYSSKNGTISVEYDREELANSAVDFSNYDEIDKLLDDGTSLTYEEFVSKVGQVEGTLVEKGTITTKYTWVNSEGGYLTASFSNSSGKCTFVTGRI